MSSRYFLLILGISIILAGIFLIIIGNLQKRSLISFESDPESGVYIDNKKIGTTPIEFETNNLNVSVKLIATDTKRSLLPYETTLSLTPHTKVIVRHNFGSTTDTTSNQILQLFKIQNSDSFLTIITNPIKAQIFLDDIFVGISPLQLSPPQGTHSLKLSKDGLVEVNTKVQVSMGMNLFISADLAREPVADSIPTQANKIATILKTPYGYVSVRKTIGGPTEISRALPGHEYEVLGFNDTKSWLQIKLNASESGWIQGLYASLR